MRIALMLPTYWPEVTRGSERLMHDLGVRLARRGHDVSVLTTHRGRPRTASEDGMVVRRRWRPPEAGPLTWYEHHLATIPGAIATLARGRFDLAHAFFLTDAWAAGRARRFGGPPFVQSIHGITTRPYLVTRRRRIEMLNYALRSARWTSVLSEAAAEPLRRYIGFEPRILPGGVDLDEFTPVAARATAPKLVCTANLGDPRKGAPVILEAFARVRREIPDAELGLVSGSDPVMAREALPALPEGARWVVAEDAAALAAEYSAAWASLLPSTDEAFGLVVLESLACGTPVIVARSGALPELVTDESLGWIVSPGSVDELAAAMSASLAVPPGGERAAAMRSRAAEFDWEAITDLYEEAYREALAAPA